jgi:tRNA A37 threonylcarbamoyladenosine dehydratase
MKYVIAFLLAIIMAPLPTWANEKESSATSGPSARSSDDAHLRVQDLPKSVQDALAEIQRLSAKVEPEIEKFGSRFRQEVDQAVKKLQQAVKSQRSTATKETP